MRRRGDKIVLSPSDVMRFQGCEHADGPALTVPSQVKRLIDEAQDPQRLCILFPGWQPWV